MAAVTADINSSAPTSSGWRFLCCRSRVAKKKTIEERVEDSKSRWRKVQKLRLLFLSLTAAKDATDERSLRPYQGRLKPDVEDETRHLKSGIIYPWSSTKTVIDSLAALLICYFAVVTPYRIGFDSDEEMATLHYFELTLDVSYFAYIVLTFFMAYYEDIEIVDDRWMVASRYLRSLFLPDLVSCPPLYLLNHNFMWLKMFRLLRVGQICTFLNSLLEFFTKAGSTETRQVMEWNTKITLFRIIQFVVYMFVTCHVIACFWHFVAIQQGVDPKDSWTQGVQMTNAEAYVVSLYWTMVTFTTVGYGDITPKTDYEIMMTMVVEFTGVLFFAYLMGSVSSIVSNMNQRALALSKRESDLEKWLMMLDRNRPDKRLTPSLHHSIRSYFLYIWKYDHSFLIRDSGFMMRLPVHLREELTRHLFSDEVERFAAFLGGCEDDFAYQIVLSMFPRRFRKLEEIIPEGELPSELCFIEAGAVNLTLHHGSQVALQLPAKSFFGDFEVVFGVDVEGLYQCGIDRAGNDGCELYCVSHDCVLKLLKQFPHSLDTVARRAYHRMQYFQCVTRMATVEMIDSLCLPRRDPELEALRQEATRIEENFATLTQEESEAMLTLLGKSAGLVISNEKLQEAERLKTKYKKLKQEITETKAVLDNERKHGEEERTRLWALSKTVTANSPVAALVEGLKKARTEA